MRCGGYEVGGEDREMVGCRMKSGLVERWLGIR